MSYIDYTVGWSWSAAPEATTAETFSADDARGAIAAAIRHITHGRNRTADDIVIHYAIPADTLKELRS